ncbi:cadmium-translocating P-type ATPase [bacterium]|nr:cadmium-translocating P-type ATPase [bacterium]
MDATAIPRQSFFERYFGGHPKELLIALLAIGGIAAYLVMKFALGLPQATADYALWAVLIFGGAPLVWDLAKHVLRFEFGADLLAGISIVTAVLLGEYLAGSIVVLMLSGGETLEAYAVHRASSALEALAARSPTHAYLKTDDGLVETPVDDIKVGDLLVVRPHDICPVDGTVEEGYGTMDESYLTGEPYDMSKAPGSSVLSGAVNGESALVVRASKRAVDSRYAQIMAVMKESEQRRPRIRRLGDQLGAAYTPVAVTIALVAWLVSGDPIRFLAVLVVATPCPLLIAIPVAIVGSISVAARRSVIIKDPTVLEQVDNCHALIFDKTGTLTYGKPTLTDTHLAPGMSRDRVLGFAASMERYSKHPLATALVDAAKAAGVPTEHPERISEKPGHGLVGSVHGCEVEVTGRSHLKARGLDADLPPPTESGLECVVLVDGKYAATFRFHDEPREGTRPFIEHLREKHHFEHVMLVSGDRESEVKYLARKVGITEVLAEQSPEQKLEIVRQVLEEGKLIFVGDGTNDAPALMQATVGIAMGQGSDVTGEAAGAVILEASLRRVDEFFHVAQRMRRIALQSAVGGMALSGIGMGFAAAGVMTPVMGAVAQEIIDVFAVLNALRAAFPPRKLTDY